MAENSKVVLEFEANTNSALKSVDKLSEAIIKAKQQVLETREAFENAKSLGITGRFSKGGGTIGGDLLKAQEKAQENLNRLTMERAKAEDKVTAALNKTTDGVKNLSKISEGLKGIWEELHDNFGKRIAIAASYKSIALIQSTIVNTTKSLLDLQKEFANIQAITASTDSTMKSLKDTILGVGQNSLFTNQELAKTTVTLGQAGYSAAEINKMLESISQLAAATGTDLTTAVGVATSALSVWNLEATQTAHVSDVLTTAVNKTKAEIGTIAQGIQYAGASFADLGISLEESASLFAAVTNAGLKSRSIVGTGSRALVTNLINPTKKLKDTLDSLGLSLEDIDVRSLGIIRVLENLKKAGFGSAEAYQALDRRAAAFYNAATSQLNTMKMLNSEFLLNGSTAKANATQMDTLSAQFTRFGNIMTSTSSKAMEPLIRLLTQLVKLLNNTTETLSAVLPHLLRFGSVWGGLKLYSAVKNLFGGMKDGAQAVVKSMGTATKAVKEFSLSLNVLTGVWNKLKGSALAWYLAIEAIIFAIDKYMSWSNSLNDEITKTSENFETSKTRTESLNAAYEELINKQKLYREDSNALSLRIAQLNQQFRETNGLLLSQSDSYDQVIQKISRAAFEQEKYQAAQLKQRSTAQMKQAHYDSKGWGGGTLGPLLESSVGWIGNKVGLNTSFDALNKRINQRLESIASLNQDEVMLLEERLRLELDRIQAIEDEEEREKQMNIYQTRLNAIRDRQAAAAKEASARLGEQVTKSVTEGEALIKELTANYKTQIENFGKGESFDVVSYMGFTQETEAMLKQLKDEKQKELEKLLEENPELKYFPNQTVSMMENFINTIEKALFELVGETSDNVEKLVSQRVATSEREFNRVMKVAASGFYPTNKAKELTQKTFDEYLEALNEQAIVQQKELAKKYNGDTANVFYQEELQTLNREQQSKILAAENAMVKTTYELDDHFQKLRGSVRSLTESFNDIKEAGERRKTRLKESSGLSDLEAFEKGWGEGFSSEAMVVDPFEKARKELEYKRASLEIDKQTLAKMKEEAGVSNELTASLQSQVGNLKSQLEAISGADEKHEEWVLLSDRLNQKEMELSEALKGRRTVTGEILELEQKIHEEEIEINAQVQSYIGKIQNPAKTGATRWMWDNMKTTPLTIDQLVDKSVFEGIDSLTSGFTDFFKNFRDGTMSTKDAFKQMCSDILISLSNMLIELGVKAMVLATLNYMTGGALGDLLHIEAAATDGKKSNPIKAVGSLVGFASGGEVNAASVPTRDSVPALLTPGEYVMKKSTVSALGTGFLNNLNNNTANALGAMSGDTIVNKQDPAVVNVWVVPDQSEAQMGPNDVIATIGKDIRTGGITKRLIQSVVAGRKM